MRDWSVSHSNDGFSVELYEVPRWARAVSVIYDKVCVVTGHILCGGGTPEFFWKIPVGRPRRDDEGYLENSLGGALYGLTNKVLSVDWKRQVTRYKTSVPDEVGKELWGEGLRYWEDDDDEEE